MSDVHAIVARCTRNGVTSWQAVANQLGCSVDQARKQYDPQYLPIRPWPHPCEAVTPEGDPIDENDMHSLAAKGPGLGVEILRILKRHGSLSVEAIANLLARPPNSIRMRLSRMCERGWVCNDGPIRAGGGAERTWRLMDAGLELAVTGCAPSIRERA